MMLRRFARVSTAQRRVWRFALWGGRSGWTQIGSREDAFYVERARLSARQARAMVAVARALAPVMAKLARGLGGIPAREAFEILKAQQDRRRALEAAGARYGRIPPEHPL